MVGFAGLLGPVLGEPHDITARVDGNVTVRRRPIPGRARMAPWSPLPVPGALAAPKGPCSLLFLCDRNRPSILGRVFDRADRHLTDIEMSAVRSPPPAISAASRMTVERRWSTLSARDLSEKMPGDGQAIR